MQKTTVYLLVGSFLLGVALRFSVLPRFDLSPALFVVLLGALLVGLLFLFVIRYKVGAVKLLTVTISILSILFGGMLGIYRADFAERFDNKEPIATYLERGITITGEVAEEVDKRSDTQHLVVAIKEIQEGDALVDSFTNQERKTTRTRVTIDRTYDVAIGDEVVITGELSKPDSFTTDVGREFNYEAYLRNQKIYYQMIYPDDVLVTDQANGFSLERTMLSVKDSFVAIIYKILPYPESALLAGELFGEKGGLGDTLNEQFRHTGLIHIVVLSGFNVTIVALFIMWLLKRALSPRVALLSAMGGIALFALLVGGGPTVIRASIMAVLVLVAKMVGREYNITRAIVLTAFIMVFINPRILVFDVAFQLSFIATLGIVYLAPWIEAKLHWVTSSFSIRDTVVATLSAQLMVLPLLMYAIGEVSLVSPIVNVLVVPIVPLAMLFGFIALLVGMLSVGLGIITAAPAYLTLAYQLQIVDWFAALPFAEVTVPKLPLWSILVVYGIIFVILFFYGKESDKGSYLQLGSKTDSMH